ncbi:response regulator transcription factor [Amycolatopsis samaneae]|uniref:Response regulator n=1 Tax=Amycolatopsis samaneae TaxID=664691 RepID=A0ABW5GWY5_9PSEU
MMTRVFLVDDHEIVRRGLADLLGSEPDLEIAGEAASVAEAQTRVPGSGADIAVLDVQLPDGNGVELCRDLLATVPGLRCLMLTSYADDEALFSAIMAGASGFVLKQVLGNDLVSAIRTVASGGSLLDSRTTAALLNRIRRQRDNSDPTAALSEQEHAVFDLIGEGLTNREIGERLFLAEKTVKNYVSRLLGKLGMQRRTQAAVLATELRGQKTSSNE